MKKSTLILLVTLFILNACKEETETPDKTDDTTAKTKTELISAAPWKYIFGTVSPGLLINGNVVTDISAGVPECILDDIEIFYDDGTGSLDEGPTKCNPLDPQSEDFMWFFNSEETTLTYDDETFNLNTLTKDTLAISTQIEGSSIPGGTPGVTHTIIYTSIH